MGILITVFITVFSGTAVAVIVMIIKRKWFQDEKPEPDPMHDIAVAMIAEIVKRNLFREKKRESDPMPDAAAAVSAETMMQERLRGKNREPDLKHPAVKASRTLDERICNVPHKYNPNFIGRDELMKDLREKLAGGDTVALTAIHGLSGRGKTEIAVEYVHRHAGDYDLIWWMAAEEEATLASEYAALAEKLDLVQSAQTDQKVKIAAVHRWLEENGGWLLVFDNAVKAADIEAYLPDAPHGHIIVTSRNHDWRGLAEEIPIDLWSETESVRFIIDRTGRTDREAAKALAERLGFLPLALVQAAAYIATTGCSIGEYVTMIEGS